MPVFFYDYYWLLEMYEDIFLRRQYEFESENPAPAIVDAGSNIGLAILFFKQLFPRATVLGFEPDPDTFELLTRNVEANRLEGVRLPQRGAVRRPRGASTSSATRRRPVAADDDVRRPPAGRGQARSGNAALGARDGAGRLPQGRHRGGRARRPRRARAEAGKLALVGRMAIEYHHHMEAGEDGLAGLLATLERGGFGYQLEARLGGAPGLQAGQFQNVLVHAYRKAWPSAPR